jgi:uncharacterized NAD-dependent epimerase/dehydratase family protein
LTNPGIRATGISLNTATLDEAGRRKALETASRITGLPAVDPVATGIGPLVDALLEIGPA